MSEAFEAVYILAEGEIRDNYEVQGLPFEVVNEYAEGSYLAEEFKDVWKNYTELQEVLNEENQKKLEQLLSSCSMMAHYMHKKMFDYGTKLAGIDVSEIKIVKKQK